MKTIRTYKFKYGGETKINLLYNDTYLEITTDNKDGIRFDEMGILLNGLKYKNYFLSCLSLMPAKINCAPCSQSESLTRFYKKLYSRNFYLNIGFYLDGIDEIAFIIAYYGFTSKDYKGASEIANSLIAQLVYEKIMEPKEL